MRWAAVTALALVASGCMTQAWTPPQPYFKTTHPEQAWQRAVAATKQHCGGITQINEDAQVIIGAWELWNTADGVILTQCIVSLMRGDDYVREVRVTFSSRRCPLSDMDQDPAELAKTCEVSDTVPEQVKNGLEVLGQKIERTVNDIGPPAP